MPSTDAGGLEAAAGIEALCKLKSTDPPLYLSSSPELSKAARLASEYLFSSLKPYTPKSPFSHLLVNGFDAEQIWQQIDLQSQPLISSLRRQVRNFEKNPEEIKKLSSLVESKGNDDVVSDEKKGETLNSQRESGAREAEDFEDAEMEAFDEEDEDDDDEEEEEGEEEERGEGVEDKFLKIKELEEFLEEDEAREYGLKRKKKGKSGNDGMDEDSDEEEEEEEEEGEDEDEDEDGDEEEDDELGVMGLEDDEDGEGLGNARCCFFCLIFHFA